MLYSPGSEPKGELVSWHLKHEPNLKKQMVFIHEHLVSHKACETKKEVDSPLTLIALSLEVII